MKTLERLVLAHLRPLVSSFMDPLQFAYQPDIGVDDAVIYLLHTSLTHLEKAGSTVRIMFFDFSSAFNTIQPRLLWGQAAASWGGSSPHYMDFGLPHTQTTVYGDDREYRGLIQDFERTGACGTTSRSTLVKPRSWWWISAGVDHSPPAPVSIQGTDIDTVKSYKRLRSFGVQGLSSGPSYDSVVASAIFYGIVCWASSITDRGQEENGQTGNLNLNLKFLCSKNIIFGDHYETHHGEKQLRKEKINDLLASLKKQQSVFTQSQEISDAAVKASYLIANETASASKPYCEGLPIFQQIWIAKRSTKSFVAFSVAIDESTDITDVAQLAIFIRGVDETLAVTEEFLELVPMTDTTTVNDIFSTLTEALDRVRVDWTRA
ncbi:hypothetical protein L3Q82_017178, partial [Scortum barcoo]